MVSKIKCKVEECAYYNDTKCEADCIEVCSCGDKKVQCSDNTACSTFRCK